MCSPSTAGGIDWIKANDRVGREVGDEPQWEQGEKGRFRMCVGIRRACGRAAALVRHGVDDPRVFQAGAGEPGSSV